MKSDILFTIALSFLSSFGVSVHAKLHTSDSDVDNLFQDPPVNNRRQRRLKGRRNGRKLKPQVATNALANHKKERDLFLLDDNVDESGASIGIGTVYGALVIGVSRNPSLKDELFKLALLGHCSVVVGNKPLTLPACLGLAKVAGTFLEGFGLDEMPLDIDDTIEAPVPSPTNKFPTAAPIASPPTARPTITPPTTMP